MRWLRSLRRNYLVSLNRIEDAAELYREVLEREPAHIPGLLVVLYDCEKRGAVEDAIDVATRALAVDPRQFMALKTLGWAHASRGDHAAARPLIARALAEFDAQKLAEVPLVLRAVEHVTPGRQGKTADSLLSWRRWAEDYVSSGTLRDSSAEPA